jgi:hypothetical protein
VLCREVCSRRSAAPILIRLPESRSGRSALSPTLRPSSSRPTIVTVAHDDGCYRTLDGFLTEHRRCGDLDGGVAELAEPVEPVNGAAGRRSPPHRLAGACARTTSRWPPRHRRSAWCGRARGGSAGGDAAGGRLAEHVAGIGPGWRRPLASERLREPRAPRPQEPACSRGRCGRYRLPELADPTAAHAAICTAPHGVGATPRPSAM